MLALMHFESRKEVVDVFNPPTDPGPALLQRFTSWENRVDNIINFFAQVQKLQKEQSRQYTRLSQLAAEKFDDDENFHEDGVIGVWRVLREKTMEVSRFYNGLPDSYNEHILKVLRTKLADIRVFKNEIQRLRKQDATKVSKKHKRFLNAVNNLNSSINRIGRPTPGNDPFVENRSIPLLF
jgi:predicted RNA-binding protein